VTGEVLPTSPGDDHRFTDQEVALVLQHAARIEERRAETGTGRGVTLPELREIAREVGLAPEVIDQAVAAVRAGVRPPHRELLGAPLSTRVVRAVPGRLGDAAMQRLVQLVEEQVEATGTVTEALGTVRWTSVGRGHKFDRTTQVSLSTTGGETQVQVAQRHPAGLRVVLQAVPLSWGVGFGAAIAAAQGASGPAVAALALGLGGVGLAIGRTIWQAVSRKSGREAERLASGLSAAARDLVDRS
jgi:hypothetical protein